MTKLGVLQWAEAVLGKDLKVRHLLPEAKVSLCCWEPAYLEQQNRLPQTDPWSPTSSFFHWQLYPVAAGVQ